MKVYSSAHSATNNVSGDVYNMNGYFSDYYNTYEGQSPDSGGYGDSYPSSDSYASTTSSPGFSFTWDGWNVQSKQGVYIHNSPYSGEYSIPYGLGSWSNPVEQPNSAYSTTPETPAPYTTPSQRYVDDIDDFFYGYDNESMYETAEQSENSITITTPSSQQVTYTYNNNTSDLEMVSDPPSSAEGEALFGPDYSPESNYDTTGEVLWDIVDSCSDDIMATMSEAEIAALATAIENSMSEVTPDTDPEEIARTWGQFLWDVGWGGLQVAGGVAEIAGGVAIATGGSAGTGGMASAPAITLGGILALKGTDEVYAGLCLIVGQGDGTTYLESGVTHIVGEEYATPTIIAIDTITGKPNGLLKEVAEDTTLRVTAKSAKSAQKGDILLTPIDETNKTRREFIKLKGSQGWKNKETGEIWQRSDTTHYGDNEWKVGLNGKPPEKTRKITVDAEGRFIKREE